jgi:hypothetical protein
MVNEALSPNAVAAARNVAALEKQRRLGSGAGVRYRSGAHHAAAAIDNLLVLSKTQQMLYC